MSLNILQDHNLDIEIELLKKIRTTEVNPATNKLEIVEFLDNGIPLELNSILSLNIEDKVFTDGFCLNVGNPHIIFFVKDCLEHDLKILGPKIENNKLFPERTNVTFAQVNDRNNITA